MVVDLNRCVGCQTCTVACKHANDTLPEIQWRRVLDVETGTFPDVQRVFLVVGCQHCADPPCVPVCPTGATFQREDGLVAMDYDRCLGCGYCAVACPYQARTIAHESPSYFGAATAQEQATAHPERLGVAQKCTFCVEKIDQARDEGLVPGRDLEVTPACAASCIAQALHFGDFNDPASSVSRMVEEQSSFQMHAQLGTDPQIRYLYETPAVPGTEPSPGARDEDGAGAESSPLTGERQTFWDARAAANFILGGAGSGTIVMASLAYLAGSWSEAALVETSALGAALMAVGLFAVFLEIGRKRRFLYALLRPQSSWMTREVYAVAVLFPCLAVGYLWPHAGWYALAATAAAAFLYCQARILHAGKGIPAWRVPIMPWMLVATGLFEGTAVVALSSVLRPEPVTFGVAIAAAGTGLAMLNAVLWHLYRRRARGWGIGSLARASLERITPWLHLLGHFVPLVAFGSALVLSSTPATVLTLGAVATLGGGITWKLTVITRAAYQQSFALARIPQRGSGRLAAPRRLA